MKKYLAEALWVLFLVLIVWFSGDPLAIWVWLAVLVYATGPISWGHLNPAVTLALLVAKKIKLPEAIHYRVAQVVWALIWSALYRVIRENSIIIMPMDGIALWRAWVAELIFTFMLAMVVYLTTAYKKSEWNQYRWAAIWLTVFVAAMSVGRISWGAFNPAVAMWSIVIDRMSGGDSGMYLWMYLVSTLLWWFVAWAIGKVLNRDQ